MTRRDDSDPGCRAFAMALDACDTLEALSEGALAHADRCPRCQHDLERRRGLAVVTARARRALEQAAPDLSPAAWARIRAAATERGTAPSWRSLFLWTTGLATAAGLVAAVWALTAGGGAGTNTGEDSRIAKPAVIAPHTPETPPAPLELAAHDRPGPAPVGPSAPLEVLTASGDFAVVVGPGAIILAASEGERYRVLGRHAVELARGTRLRVRDVAPTGVEFELIDGLASFDVHRAAGEAPFRVHAGDVHIEVRGTFWSVERREAAVIVSVERGRVAVLRDGEEEVEVEAGERVVFPRLDVASEPEDTASPVKRSERVRPRPERMVEVEVGHSAMRGADEADAEVDHLIPPILGAIRSGRCVQALSALERISRAVHERLPRSAVWLTGYCQRSLGNLEASRRSFARYGTGGPWPVPAGDELPPLPR